MPRTGNPPTLFLSESDLADYSKDSRKIYPKDNAYAGGLLRYLLRRIVAPRVGREGQASYILEQIGNGRSAKRQRRY